LDKSNAAKIMEQYDFIVDGSDNFKTKFLINDFSLKLKKFLVTGAISKFDGHIFTYNFDNKKTPCLRCFFQEDKISDDILNCEYEGVLGTVAGIVGILQANEVLKQILNIGKNLNGEILILDLLLLNFRKIKIKKIRNCIC
jgi:adenylyltransferase/sulfurtransferase